MTWTNKRKGRANVKERLDRALANPEWRQTFSEAIVKHLPRTKGDHHPLLIDLEGPGPVINAHKPFRMEAAWLTHKDFPRLISEEWSYDGINIDQSIRRLTDACKTWNSGDLFRRKRRLLARIEGVQRVNHRSRALEKLEDKLVTDYNEVFVPRRNFVVSKISFELVESW